AGPAEASGRDRWTTRPGGPCRLARQLKGLGHQFVTLAGRGKVLAVSQDTFSEQLASRRGASLPTQPGTTLALMVPDGRFPAPPARRRKKWRLGAIGADRPLAT